ncbi:hypothetical protein Godav_025990 [Gossypium davidsonii]|uniref:hAT-like transposase RNase-H fold domain-containing protein n=2 Tax=Gossypium TaxID=3633 RepID=A0A7J8THF0_GOSDV|nr:hypothetical protein [Gossypium davidsonii]MBA0645534.1 hypothetical protein [Gossypium klotzschianum]
MLEFTLYYKDVLDYWGQRDKDYLIFSVSDEEWRNYCFTTIYDAHASDFVQTILNNLKFLFDEYVKNSKSTSSSLTRSSNVLDNNPIDSSLYQLKVNRVDFGEDYDESDDYK